jgi:hypothetical protein
VAAAGDDDLVAALVESLGETMADAGSTAGDEDGVVCELHGARSDAEKSVGEAVIRKIGHFAGEGPHQIPGV